MLKIKLSPVGKKHAVNYRIVVVEEHSKLTGSATDTLGFYHPQTGEIKVDSVRLKAWMVKGAQPTPGVRSLLKL